MLLVRYSPMTHADTMVTAGVSVGHYSFLVVFASLVGSLTCVSRYCVGLTCLAFSELYQVKQHILNQYQTMAHFRIFLKLLTLYFNRIQIFLTIQAHFIGIVIQKTLDLMTTQFGLRQLMVSWDICCCQHILMMVIMRIGK